MTMESTVYRVGNVDVTLVGDNRTRNYILIPKKTEVASGDNREECLLKAIKQIEEVRDFLKHRLKNP